jgi:drug/metabolite transporter (DMT)-like permease
LLVGSPGKGGMLASLAAVLAALCYAVGSTVSSRLLSGTAPLVIAAGSSVVAAILMTPLGVTHLPTSVPGWKESASVITLGVVGTGVAYIIFFALLRSAGPSRTILVTYLVPGVALLYGVVLLGEPLETVYVAGLALILVGVVLAGRGGRLARSEAKLKTPTVTSTAFADGDR